MRFFRSTAFNRILAILAAPICVLTVWTLRTPIARILHMRAGAFCAVGAAVTALTQTFPEDAAQPVSSQNFGFFEAIRYQGVTTDGKSWFYSWNLGLMKSPLSAGLTWGSHH